MSKKKPTSLVTWRWNEPPLKEGDVAKIERLWSEKLPGDYLECARLNHGGHPTPPCFDMPNRTQAVFNRLLPFSGKTDRLDLVWIQIRDRLPERVYPFASDPFGNYLCFDYRDSVPSVVFWDHERAMADPSEAITTVCRSFSDLLQRLYNPG